MMRPKNDKPAREHGLRKIHKEVSNIPKFGPIIDTTGTTHCLVGKYLASLLNPLTNNEYSVKNTLAQPIELNVYHNICLKMVINIYHLT